jgi:hypothetical protein
MDVPSGAKPQPNAQNLNAETLRTPRTAEKIKLCESLRSPRLCVETSLNSYG